MPYKTFWESKCIVWKFFGNVTAEEIEKANEEFFGDNRSDWAKFQLIDALDVTSVEWSESDITAVAAHDIGAHHIIRNLKIAYVSKDEKLYPNLKNILIYRGKLNVTWKFKGFEDLHDAWDWLESS